MPAYILCLREKMKDPSEMKNYSEKARKADNSKVKALSVYGKLETLEGAPFEGVVVLEFPTAEDAKRWYFSPEYQAAIVHRQIAADYRFVLVEGT
jgi:uncharacterized protein (DUF1330 family)